MKKGTVSVEPAFLRPDDAADFLGGEQVLKLALAHGWLQPTSQAKRLTLYATKALKTVAARIEVDGLPGREVKR